MINNSEEKKVATKIIDNRQVTGLMDVLIYL